MAGLKLCSILLLLFSWISNAQGIKTYEMDMLCGESVLIGSDSSYAIKLKLTERHHYESNMNCGLQIRGPIGQRLLVQLLDVDIDCTDYLQLYSGTSQAGTAISSRICGEYDLKPMTTSGEDLYVKFTSDRREQNDGFKLLISVFHTGSCYASEFMCGNGRCIDSSLYCDDYDNCGDESDICTMDYKWWIWTVVGIVVFLIICIFVSVVCCCLCKSAHAKTKRQTTGIHYHSNTQSISQIAASPANPWYVAPAVPGATAYPHPQGTYPLAPEPFNAQVMPQPPAYTPASASLVHPDKEAEEGKWAMSPNAPPPPYSEKP